MQRMLIRRLSSTSRTILYSRGLGLHGALGQGPDLLDSESFKPVPLPLQEGDVPKQISAGWGHSAVVTHGGQLFLFGRPYDFKKLMRYRFFHVIIPSFVRTVAKMTNTFADRNDYYDTPALVYTQKVKYVRCGGALTCYLTEGGDVYAFGLNRNDQCGFKTELSKVHVFDPTKVPNLPKIKQIDVGLQHCIVLSEDGRVFTWGKTESGRVGPFDPHLQPSTRLTKDERIKFDGETKNFLTMPPRHIPIMKYSNILNKNVELKVKKVCAGFAHSAILSEDGAVYVFGQYLSEKMKLSKQGNQLSNDHEWFPRRIELPNNEIAVNIETSNYTTVIQSNENKLYVVGREEGVHDNFIFLTKIATTRKKQFKMFLHPIEVDCSVIDLSQFGKKWKDLKYKLTKGHQSVSVHFDAMLPINFDSAETPATEDNTKTDEKPVVSEKKTEYCQSFDIVITDKNAKLVPHLPYLPAKGEKWVNIVDYSAGWMHDLLLVKE